MKIGCKKIRPMANPVPLPKALASLTLYIMLIMASMIFDQYDDHGDHKLSFVSKSSLYAGRIRCQEKPMSAEIRGCQAIFIEKINRHILGINTFSSGLPCFGKDSFLQLAMNLQKHHCECDHQIHTAQ